MGAEGICLLMFRSAILLVLSLVSSVGLPAQTGPGGVGSTADNGIWLRADVLSLTNGAPVANWTDGSGNDNNAQQADATRQPTYVTGSALNGQAVVRLSGTDDNQLLIDDADKLDGGNRITYFAVIRPSNLNGSTPRGIIGKRTTYTITENYAYTWFFHTNNLLNLDVNSNDNRFSATTAFANGTNYILSFDFDGTRAQAERARVYNGSTILATKAITATTVNSSREPVVLGALNEDYGNYLGADYAEVIHYNRGLSSLERQLVNNYLSGKYAIPLATGDVYAYDSPTNGDYDFDIAGIGRISATDQVTQAQGSGILQLENPSDLNDNEYLLWGHDGQELVMGSTNNNPPTTSARLNRTWRLSEVASSGAAVDVGAVDMAFDLGGLGLSEFDVQLLVDTDDDGTFTNESPITGARLVGAEVFQFDGVTALTNGRRFTIGRANASLPIVLLDLRVRQEPAGRVVLEWETISETDNSYYAVERSTAKQSWQEIGRVDGSGTTTTVQRYQYIDIPPAAGRIYYRIQQVDFDGRAAHSQVLAIDYPAQTPQTLALYPNPTREAVYVDLPAASPETVIRLRNMTGQEVTLPIHLRDAPKGTYRLELGALPQGFYLVQVGERSGIIRKQ